MTASVPRCPPCDVLLIYHPDDFAIARHLQDTIHELAPDATCRLKQIHSCHGNFQIERLLVEDNLLHPSNTTRQLKEINGCNGEGFTLYLSETDRPANESESKSFNLHRNASFARDTDMMTHELESSVRIWLLLSERAIHDPEMAQHIDELIMRSVTSGQTQFVPVFTKPKDQFGNLPYGLQAYTGLTLTNLNLNRNISRMLNNEYHRQQREHLLEKYQ